jgi:YD repeat-containing protein
LSSDALSQIHETTDKGQGDPQTITDPVGRQTSYVYDTNGQDVLQVRQTSAGVNDLLAGFGNYLAHDRPQSSTDAGGGTGDEALIPILVCS